MRKHLSFASTKKSTHIRRRYSHDVSRPQLIQENVNIDIQGSQSTLPENIQDDYDDDMDFQYNYRSEELPKDEDRESSKEDENEESSENENKESSENENEEFSEDEKEYDNIIDKALDEDKMPSYDNNNEFAPYFENFTTASLFCWLQKHNISTNAYKDLAEIIHNPQFMPTHVIKNVQRFRKWRQHLPLLSISERSISISSRKLHRPLRIQKWLINYL